MSNHDQALERLHLGDLEYAGGLANHGPMATEALEHLGHPALIPALLDRYAPRLPPASQGRPIAPAEWSDALGDAERRFDWVCSFEQRLAEGDWRAQLAELLPMLMPGLSGAVGHGLLRTAHAVRALGRADVPLRRAELARGLAHWAARHRRLPGLPGRTASVGGPDGVATLVGIPQRPEQQRPEGPIALALETLDGDPAFGRSIEAMVLPSEEVGPLLSEVARTAARLYLEHPGQRIVYVHTVTIPAALRSLAELLPGPERSLAFGYAIQTIAALHALYGAGGAEPSGDPEVERTARSWDEIRYRAACSIQEHAIKMASACWQEYQLTPDPVFARAAADAALRLEGRHGGGLC